MDRYALGITMIGAQIATLEMCNINFSNNYINLYYNYSVLESRNDKFKVGDHIYGSFGWRTHTVFNPDLRKDAIPVFVLPPLGKHSLSLGIGAIGMTGFDSLFNIHIQIIIIWQFADALHISGSWRFASQNLAKWWLLLVPGEPLAASLVKLPRSRDVRSLVLQARTQSVNGLRRSSASIMS